MMFGVEFGLTDERQTRAIDGLQPEALQLASWQQQLPPTPPHSQQNRPSSFSCLLEREPSWQGLGMG
jgi:hypothetical protein